MRYLLGSPERLERVRLAIDQYHGLRDKRGNPVRAVNTVHRGGEQVAELASDDYCTRLGVAPTSLTSPIVIVSDGSAVLEIPETARVAECLGKRVAGGDIPSDGELVHEGDLPDAVRRALTWWAPP